jgi:chemotaxis protein MotB
MAASGELAPIIVKKVKKGGHGHHGGAWKIAYADFVTAMMAFFLMLWLISMTTEEQKKGLADYFAPASASQSNSGAGGVLGGTSFDTKGAKSSNAINTQVGVAVESSTPGQASIAASAGANADQVAANPIAAKASPADLRSTYDEDFHGAAASVRQAWQANPDVAQMNENLIVQETKEGLDIVIQDQQGDPMFPEGSKYPTESARKAIAALGPILEKLGSQIEISGHTAAGGIYPNARYGAWELSSDRANVVREILSEFGLSDQFVSAVSGKASNEPFFPDDPYLASNSRIEITVLYAAPPVPPGMAP